MKITENDIAKLFGVEVGEEFIVRRRKHKFWSNTVLYLDNDMVWKPCMNGISDLIDEEITRLPWRPKEGEFYWYPVPDTRKSDEAIWCCRDLYDTWRLDRNLCFKTREEAEAKWAELYGVEVSK